MATGAPTTGIYIFHAEPSSHIKLGISTNVTKRLSTLRVASPYKLSLVFFGIFGEVAPAIERGAHTLLKPWRVHGEWFAASPFLAGIAIEAVRDNCARRRAFIDLEARQYAARGNAHESIPLDEQSERDFPDLYSRFQSPKMRTIKLGRGFKVVLPPEKRTRLIVEGFPEIRWGIPRDRREILSQHSAAKRRIAP